MKNYKEDEEEKDQVRNDVEDKKKEKREVEVDEVKE